MITSMTGYGRMEGRFETTDILVEIRSVNHRYCEVAPKLPRILSPYEQHFKRLVQRRFARGRFDMTVSLNGGSAERPPLKLNTDLARQVHGLLDELRRTIKLSGSVTLDHLLQFKEVLMIGTTQADPEKLCKAVTRLCAKAMDRLEGMRVAEGRALAKDIKQRFKHIEATVKKIEGKAPQIARAYGERLRDRIRTLTSGSALDEGRVLQEIAAVAERCDVSEEVVRLRSHLGQCLELERSDEPPGRRLEFFLQEMNREANTIGSKANDAGVANWVVDMKAELEKIREQVQNVE